MPGIKIGLVPGSFKPYHRGHDELIRLAAGENDLVLVFNSDATRGEIDGRTMVNIINRFVKPTLPKNVRLMSVGVPVGALFQELEYAEKNKSEDAYTIYSDSEDIRKYGPNVLKKYAPTLYENGQIWTRGVERGVETTDVSGTKMREFLAAGDVRQFSKLLPPAVQGHSAEIIDMLKKKVRESLLKTYIHELLKEHIRR